MPKELMELMRHKSIDTTMRFYVGQNADKTASILWEAYRESSESTTRGSSRAESVEGRAGKLAVSTE